MPLTMQQQPIEQLYVISDLHLGGHSATSQICNQGSLLAGLVRHITEQAKIASGRVVLLLAGDIIDFLLTDTEQRPAVNQPYLRGADDALLFLESVFLAFHQFFDDLTVFLSRPNAELVCLLGNHDLELSYRPVWQRLDERLMSAAHPRQGILQALHSGDAGYPCRVGPASVLCVHGNAVDPWNEVDYGSLQRLKLPGSDVPPLWKPNAGTALVVDVINILKREGYAFVDLLKPEGELVPQILVTSRLNLVSKPAWAKFIRSAPSLLPRYLASRERRVRRHLRRSVGLLGGHDAPSLPGSLEPQPSRRAARTIPSAQSLQELGQGSEQFLEQARRDDSAGLEPADLVSADQGELGWMKWALDRALGRPPKTALRELLLDSLIEDQTFSITEPDAAYQELFEWTRRKQLQYDFLIAGHTHLARAIESEDGSYYFNTGTWMQLIRFPLRVLSQEKRFGSYYDALIEQRRPLPALADIPGLILNRPTVARLIAKDNKTCGELCRVKWQANESGPVDLVPLQEFPFTVCGEDGP